MKMKHIVIIILALVFIIFIFLLTVPIPRQHAWIDNSLLCKHENAECSINESKKHCCNGLVCVPFNKESGNGKCMILPTPTPTKSCIPTISPTPTVSEEVAITSTGSTGGTGISDGLSSNPGATQAHNPSCTIPFGHPILQGFQALGNGSVSFSWWGISNIDKYAIIYGYSPDSLLYGEDNIPSSSTSITINGLIPGRNVWAKVSAWRDGCAEDSNLFDPIVR